VRAIGSITNIVITWRSGGGPVTGYQILQNGTIIGNVSSNTFTFSGGSPWYAFIVRALFSFGSADSAPTWLDHPVLSTTPLAFRGPGGQWWFGLTPIVPQMVKVEFYCRAYDYDTGDYDIITNLTTFYPSNFVNGLVAVPPQPAFPELDGWRYCKIYYSELPPTDEVSFQAYSTAGSAFLSLFPFADSRAEMKANLRFLLRSASRDYPFGYLSNIAADGTHYPDVEDNPPSWFSRDGASTNYEFYGYSIGNYLQEARPVHEHVLWRNFIFNPSDYSQTGVAGDTWNGPMGSHHYPALFDPLFEYLDDPTVTRPYLFSAATNVSIWSDWMISDSYGVTEAANGTVFIQPNFTNCFGLKITGGIFPSQGSMVHVTAGAPSSVDAYGLDSGYYLETEAPVLTNAGYYFAITNGYLPDGPGYASFSPSAPPPPLIMPFGEPRTIASWAKFRITNTSAEKYAYLQQYFDKAYEVDETGAVTTNQAGAISPYGEFFPAKAGPIAVVTMPDPDTGAVGTGIVNVIKLQLDVNHDGVMDLSFGGPDNTSWRQPYTFWINNDFDRWHKVNGDLAQDDLGSTEAYTDCPYTNGPVPDCEYRQSDGDRTIPSTRDLEDFPRLWLCGLTSNLVASLPPGITGELSWGDKGHPDTNNPTIDIFSAAFNAFHPAGYGTDSYLTNASDADAQTTRSYIGERLGPGDSLTVLSNGIRFPPCIWCGVKKGSGALTLTITQGGTNTIAQTSAYIKLVDIKDMYERYTVGDEVKFAPSNRVSLAGSFQYPATRDANTPYILIVHDYDLPPWKKDRYAETALKRLYWQGYQGRLGLFRWPGVWDGGIRPLDDSEHNAWRSGGGLLTLLTNLNAQYSTNFHLLAHGYGAIAAGEALRLAGTNWVVNTYIALQGAVPSHCYDPFAPVRLLAPGTDNGTPNRFLAYYTNGAPPFFYNVGGADNYFNYFNTNDFLLTNRWRTTQDAKPDFGYQWDGTNFSSGVLAPQLLLFPVDTFEIFSYCDEARCDAIGAQANLAGPFWSGSGYNQVDLAGPPYLFSGQEKEHRRQFLNGPADVWSFWRSVLRSVGLKP
jgi:hypothetical protein